MHMYHLTGPHSVMRRPIPSLSSRVHWKWFTHSPCACTAAKCSPQQVSTRCDHTPVNLQFFHEKLYSQVLDATL